MIAIYHWFDEPNDSPPYANLRVPIIVSIATLRAVNPDIPILVLAQEDRDWGHFPDKLNFQVRKVHFALTQYEKEIKGWRHLSRIFDLQLTQVADIMYVDSDVFWFRDPLPLARNLDKFCFNGWNTGFFYYNQNLNKDFFNIFDAYTRSSIYSEEVREIMKTHVGYHSWHGVWDEMITTYMNHHHPELFNIIPPEEHSSGRSITNVDASKVKMFHCNGTMVSNKVPKSLNEHIHCRGLLGLIVKEFYDNMMKVLDEGDMRYIYSLQEMSYYLPHQFSLLDDPHRLTRTKSEDGHFHVEKCLRPQRTLLI
jgi:hypothetical protein